MFHSSNSRTGLSTAVAAVPISHYAPACTRPLGMRSLAAVIPGDSVLESTVVGGTATFFDIYQNVIGMCSAKNVSNSNGG